MTFDALSGGAHRGGQRLGRLASPSPIVVGVVGVAITIYLVVASLAPVDFDMTLFIKTGTEPTAYRAQIEELLGPVVLAPRLGHDGQAYFLLALDPLLIDQDRFVVLDDPAYRAQRILYPALVGFFGLLPPKVVVWTLVVVNIVAMGLGSVWTAGLAAHMGKSSWLGLSFALNIGMISELRIDGGGIVAWAAAVAGLLALSRGRRATAAFWFLAAVLARETMMLVVAGAAFAEWRVRRPFRLIALVPLVSLFAWTGWVVVRLGLPQDALSQNLGIPFAGLAAAVGGWRPVEVLVAASLFVAAWIIVGASVTRGGALALGSSGFVVLGCLLTGPIWGHFYDFSRAIAPILTSAVLLAAPARLPRQTHR